MYFIKSLQTAYMSLVALLDITVKQSQAMAFLFQDLAL